LPLSGERVSLIAKYFKNRKTIMKSKPSSHNVYPILLFGNFIYKIEEEAYKIRNTGFFKSGNFVAN